MLIITKDSLQPFYEDLANDKSVISMSINAKLTLRRNENITLQRHDRVQTESQKCKLWTAQFRPWLGPGGGGGELPYKSVGGARRIF